VTDLSGLDFGSVDSSGRSARSEAITVSLSLTEDLVTVLAQRVAGRLESEQANNAESWIGVDAAATHLACPKSRIYRLVSQRRIPFEKDGARLLFRRADLDVWVERGGAGR
jgi:excisionase family DNA binding protein